MNAIIIPTGNSTGAKTTRAKVSLSVTTAIPKSPEAGIK